MGGFFNMDGPFVRFGNAIADIMILSVIWIIFSIPIFTAGAATTALFYVTTRRISDRQGYLFRDFYSSFKANFKKATILWILWLFLIGFIANNIRLLINYEFNPTMAAILLPIQIVIMVELVISSIYLYPITARFEMDIPQTIKTAFFMANWHLITTISALVTIAAIVFAALMLFPPIFIVAMGLYSYLTSFMIMQVFKKYRPEIDADELALEPLPTLDFSDDDDNTP